MFIAVPDISQHDHASHFDRDKRPDRQRFPHMQLNTGARNLHDARGDGLVMPIHMSIDSRRSAGQPRFTPPKAP
jgi:hypothetical protein